MGSLVHRRSISLGLLCVAISAGCVQRTATTAPVAEPSAPAAVPEPVNTVLLRYSAKPAQFTQRAQLSSEVDGGVQPNFKHKLSYEAAVVREPVARGASLRWTFETLHDALVKADDPLPDDLTGEMVLDDRGQRMPLPQPKGEADERQDERLKAAAASFVWPMLPTQALVPGETLTLDGTRPMTLSGVDFELATHIEYTLIDYRPDDGVATLRIDGEAHGSVMRDEYESSLSQETHSTVILDLELGAPRSWDSETTQTFEASENALTLSQIVKADLVEAGGEDPSSPAEMP